MIEIEKLLQIKGTEIRLQTNIKSERAFILSQIVEVYKDVRERVVRDRINTIRYIEFCKDKKLNQKDKTSETAFFKSPKFLKELSNKRIAVLLAKLNNEDLCYVLSRCRERLNSGYSVGSYLVNCTRLPNQ